MKTKTGQLTMSARQLFKSVTPAWALQGYRRVRASLENQARRTKSAEAVFTEIYRKNQWGGKAGEFCSGSGTVNERVSSAYIAVVTQLAETHRFASLRAVDLGCGDMRIGGRIAPLFASYVGVDVVRPLVEHLSARMATARMRFACLDITAEELPEGEVCMVRQVLQHLSNAQIQRVLRKLARYRFVLISEHLPSPDRQVRKNLDKPHGGDIRLYADSGVYVTDPPFSLPRDRVEVVLEVPAEGFTGCADRGVIQTVLYRPRELQQ